VCACACACSCVVCLLPHEYVRSLCIPIGAGLHTSTTQPQGHKAIPQDFVAALLHACTLACTHHTPTCHTQRSASGCPGGTPPPLWGGGGPPSRACAGATPAGARAPESHPAVHPPFPPLRPMRSSYAWLLIQSAQASLPLLPFPSCHTPRWSNGRQYCCPGHSHYAQHYQCFDSADADAHHRLQRGSRCARCSLARERVHQHILRRRHGILVRQLHLYVEVAAVRAGGAQAQRALYRIACMGSKQCSRGAWCASSRCRPPFWHEGQSEPIAHSWGKPR